MNKKERETQKEKLRKTIKETQKFVKEKQLKQIQETIKQIRCITDISKKRWIDNVDNDCIRNRNISEECD